MKLGNEKFTKVDVVLVGYENQENIGLRSIEGISSDIGLQSEIDPLFPRPI